MDYKWQARFGHFEEVDGRLEFEGGTTVAGDGQELPSFANLLCNAQFSDGCIRGKIQFADTSSPATCAFIVRDNPDNGAFIIAGLGGGGGVAYSVRAFDGSKWIDIKALGEFGTFVPGRAYEVEVRVSGARLSLFVEDVLVLACLLPGRLPVSQVGLWCQSRHKIIVTDFAVESSSPVAFVIMQFSPPYNELYSDVIAPICAENGVTAYRADETHGPGLILQDVTNRIIDATLVIAEITPANQNVFYELGYSHALNKPTILIAERGKQLPFDISGYRTLFYDNSIGGKGKMETELRKHLRAIMSSWGYSGNGRSGHSVATTADNS